ncbi:MULTISPECIES: radical SAM protein [unclassified Rhizobium]|uniref:radical SAM protein n=1 Tax=unclassified Rhizobium TaxID=2613769 RepID=UPI001A988258|nr:MULTISPECIES: radical SAM protein [unclassified Rhizobium]MBX5187212.1 radical SAM protein [Rhizobium sp. NZLR5]MBX5204200.1 radical SAM protein [Rhizobium sp. NZLR1]QSZ21922.1 radical SAM protein [Rhizobium sp. NZLR1]
MNALTPSFDPQIIQPLTLIITKLTARCNLDCPYCYEFNLKDTTWKDSPKKMSDDVFDALLLRVGNHARLAGQQRVHFSFHGGEPTMVGIKRFEELADKARRALDDLDVRISIQTNGALLNGDWARTLRRLNVNVGVSLDGPKHVHDRMRIDHRGRGSYESVRRGIEALQDADVRFGILTVITLGADPLEIHHHLLELGCTSLSYLLPDLTHDTIGTVREQFGPTPCADFLIPIFDDWWFNSTLDVRIRNFWDIARAIMGGPSHVDALGNRPLRYLVVSCGGDIEGLDVLKACEDGMVKTGMNVLSDEFSALPQKSPLHAEMVFGRMPLSKQCQSCVERDTCGGGYHPHRYSRANGFDNPSVWCADLMRLFTHIRARMEIDHSETNRRRSRLMGTAPIAAPVEDEAPA